MPASLLRRGALSACAGLCVLLLAGPGRAAEGEMELLKQQVELQRRQLEQQAKQLNRLQQLLEQQIESPVSLPDQKGTAAGAVVPSGEAAKKAPATTPAAPDKGFVVGSDLTMKANWIDGVVLESPGKDFRLHIGGQLQHDSIWFDQPEELKAPLPIGVGGLDDGTFFRRARIVLDGKLHENIEFDAQFECANTTDVIFNDLWIGVTEVPILGNIRAGHVKMPQGLESITSNRFLTFTERGNPFDAFYQEYDPGVLVFNTFFNQRLALQGAWHRVEPDDRAIDLGDGEYAMTGRIAGLPIYDEASNGRCLLHLAGSGCHRVAELDRTNGTRGVQFRSREEARDATFLPRFIDTGRILADSSQIYGGEAALVMGPLSIQGEYAMANVRDARFPASPLATDRGTPLFDGYYVFVSYFVTGEHRPYDRRLARFTRVIPYENAFFVRNDKGGTSFGMGAIELLARYSRTCLNDNGINGGVLEDVTLGFNWYLNPNTRIQGNYIIADRQVLTPQVSGTIDTFHLRFALDF